MFQDKLLVVIFLILYQFYDMHVFFNFQIVLICKINMS